MGGLLRVGPYGHRDDEVIPEWKRNIDTLAECPNVYMKLGGLGQPRYGFDWYTREQPIDSISLAEDLAPLLEYCIEKFGPERCMFECNFPPDKVSYSFNVLYRMIVLYTFLNKILKNRHLICFKCNFIT